MTQFTQVELNGLKEQITSEILAAVKCQEYSTNASDPEIKQMCQSLTQLHQNHVNTLTKLLNQGAQGSQFVNPMGFQGSTI